MRYRMMIRGLLKLSMRGATKLDPVEEDRLVLTLLVDADITDSTSLTIIISRRNPHCGVVSSQVGVECRAAASWLQALRACYQKASWSQDCWLLPEGLGPEDAASSKVTVH